MMTEIYGKMLTPELKTSTSGVFMKLVDNEEDNLDCKTAAASMQMSSNSSEGKNLTDLDIQKLKFKRKMLGTKRTRDQIEPCFSKASWSQDEYDAYIKTVRRHGKNQAKIREALEGKTKPQIERFNKAICRQIESMSDHPEVDILNVLLEDTEDKDDVLKSVLQLERERKKKERIKRKMLGVGLPTTCAAPCFRLNSKRPAAAGTDAKTIN